MTRALAPAFAALCLGLAALLLVAMPARAQTAIYEVVSSCGAQSYVAGTSNLATMDTAGNVCSNTSGGGGAAVTTSPTAVTATDRGGTIATGGTVQTLAALNASRKMLWVQNPCNATEDLYVSTTGNAVTTAGAPDDADLAPCASWTASYNGLVIRSAVTVIAVTTGHAFIAKEAQ